MANIINMSNGSITQVLLASLTSIPTSSTAVSGTTNWKKFDAIYFVTKMHYKEAKDVSTFTNLIFTKNVVIGDSYNAFRASTSNGEAWEANLNCWFFNDQIKISKKVYYYDILSVSIYGVNF